ncbi:Rossmann-like and DUF2520 domain-containing protein [Hymenobacter mucosus]|uniref:Predicted oxidoreductase, contains short-chain dehydrogenase (SDR) and DUF2520 domains n=1 Tax=Hymenobacter mucosus TaxID=1411120 RepID=A0A238ZNC1_9BACT|nr:Rossmann-like and DUF2520 domain-containing protein [Hymenobacter mucosus]SNR84905.1 Predicted oxidoreductase, contains short-chain dehydrogenase (SDR) and DUF2520 domains [Hymenobacter mucosus]
MEETKTAAKRVVLLGAGRVAQHLAPALLAAGYHVAHIWSRSLASAQALAATVPGATAGATAALPAADVYILAVPDAAVPAVLTTMQFPSGALVAHTAGALPLSVFSACPQVRGGVVYPIQTFSPGRMIDWGQVPLCVEAAEAAGEATLLTLAQSLSHNVRLVDSAQRLRLHVGAVFACNFTNHLLGISHALLTEDKLPFELLAPLVRETVEKALEHPPFMVQTGPAARYDAPTLARHEQALAEQPGWLAIYKHLTASIQEKQHAIS